MTAAVIDPHDITHLLWTATRNKRSAADELQAQLTADRTEVDRLVAMFERGNLRSKQAEMRRRGLQRLQESVARQEALLVTYASLQAPGALPVVHKSEAPCEAEIAAWAERLQFEVEGRVWDFLYGQEKVG